MNINNQHYLDEEEKKDIYKTIVNIFGDETSRLLTMDFKKFKVEVDLLVKEMQFETYSYIDRWNYSAPIEVIRRKMGQEVQKKNYLAMKGFLLIFKFREFLFNQAINYRYYYEDSITGDVQSRTFGELDLLNLTKFSDSGIALDTKKIKNTAKEGDTFFTSKMNQYYNIYTSPKENKYMKVTDSKKYNLRIVRSQIMNKYGNINEGLWTKDKKHYQTFNAGHIYESLDLTLMGTFMDYGKEKMDFHVDNYMFGKFLKRDKVVASKGGDNFLTNTSIKSNEANLYSFNTIANQIYIISKMLQTIDSNYLKHEIIELFVDDSEKSKDIADRLEQSAQAAVEKLLTEIQKNLSY